MKQMKQIGCMLTYLITFPFLLLFLESSLEV